VARSTSVTERRRRWRAVALGVLGAALAAWVLAGLVPRPLLVNRAGMSQVVLARDGSLLRLSLSGDDHYRLWTPLAEIPPAMVDATLLQEDRFFFRHPGVNPWALVRAAVRTYLWRDRRLGASTLTMQVARLRFDLDTRTWHGKLRQMLAAFALEWRYTKREILEAYLNLAPYGGNVAGVGAASWVALGKPVARLTPAEALTLAVIPKSPTARAPFTADGRRAIVAARHLLAARWNATAAPIDAASLDAVALRSREALPFRAPHLADRVLAEAPFAPRLETTVDPALQALVEQEVSRFLAGARRVAVRNAAVLLVDHRTMEALAYVGSADHGDVAIEGAVDGVRARRSPGSALKPFLYGLALDAGLINPETMLEDTSLTLSSWNPENFDRDFVGPIDATDALVRSRNLPAVQLANRLPAPGLHGFLAAAGIGGLRSPEFYGLALALGGVEVRLDELVRLYALLAEDGVERELVFRRNATGGRRGAAPALLSPQAAFLVLDMLRANPRPGDEAGAESLRPRARVAWKTGTSFGFRDAWAVGVAGRFVLGVWAGNFDGTPNPALVGRETAGPLFFRIVDALAATGESLAPAAPPPGVARASVCALGRRRRTPLPGPEGDVDHPGPLADRALHRAPRRRDRRRERAPRLPRADGARPPRGVRVLALAPPGALPPRRHRAADAATLCARVRDPLRGGPSAPHRLAAGASHVRAPRRPRRRDPVLGGRRRRRPAHRLVRRRDVRRPLRAGRHALLAGPPRAFRRPCRRRDRPLGHTAAHRRAGGRRQAAAVMSNWDRLSGTDS
jgi:penicillin-binding protein 1C